MLTEQERKGLRYVKKTTKIDYWAFAWKRLDEKYRELLEERDALKAKLEAIHRLSDLG